MQITIIGGGIIGLSSAYYLKETGHEVTVIDRSDMRNNCSYGNAGYVCPSHFIPLATPGIVKQGLKWMLNSRSPFYVQPRLSRSLVDWGWKFMKSATDRHVQQSGAPLRDIALLSQRLYEEWAQLPQFSFAYEKKGLLEIFQTAAAGEHAKHTVEQAHALGLTGTRMLGYDELQSMEPQTRINAMGAIYFDSDAHLYPNRLMEQLIAHLQTAGVRMITGEEVTGFEHRGNNITRVITAANAHDTDAVVLAAGSWSREVAEKMEVSIPLVAGRGYSVTLEDSPYHINHPSVLVEGRVALTPMDGNKIRFGGTMEITATATPPRLNRVEGILQAVSRYYPEFTVAMPAAEKIWYGYRPCSADGLPYIGRTARWQNTVIATGHAMLGLSLGPATGKLVSELLNGQSPSMDITAFDPDRFAGRRRRLTKQPA